MTNEDLHKEWDRFSLRLWSTERGTGTGMHPRDIVWCFFETAITKARRDSLEEVRHCINGWLRELGIKQEYPDDLHPADILDDYIFPEIQTAITKAYDRGYRARGREDKKRRIKRLRYYKKNYSSLTKK